MLNNVSGISVTPGIVVHKKVDSKKDFWEREILEDSESEIEEQPSRAVRTSSKTLVPCDVKEPASEAGKASSETLTPCDLDDDYIHPVHDFNCAISTGKIEKPGILTCGHFFELSLIDQYRQRLLANQQDFVCPQGCGKVKNRIIESNQLRNGIEDSRKQISDLNKESKSFSSQLEEMKQKMSMMDSKLESTTTEIASIKSASTSRKIFSLSEEIEKLSKEILKQNELLKEQRGIDNKRIENIQSKRLIDNIYVIFWPNYVLDRGLQPDQISKLKEGSSNEEKIKELKEKLEKLVIKRRNLELTLAK